MGAGSVTDERSYHGRSWLIFSAFGVAVGLAYLGLIVKIRDSLSAAEAMPDEWRRVAPHVMFMMLSIGLGWVFDLLAQYRGLVSPWPSVYAGGVAVCVGTIFAWPLPNQAWIALGVGWVSLIAIGWWRRQLEQ